jgi:hypothetical protein
MTIASKPANANYRAHYDETFGKKDTPVVLDKIVVQGHEVSVLAVDNGRMTCRSVSADFVLTGIPVAERGTAWNWPK